MPPSMKETGRTPEAVDVVIVGAGVSGINTAYWLLKEFPDIKLTILEARGDIGGTWDLFKYPGVRSDSDLYSYGFTWHPWPFPQPVAEGRLIKQYLKDCASQHGVSQHIRLQHKVLSADWSQDVQKWSLVVNHDDLLMDISASFLVLGSGYYDYYTPLQTVIPGLEDFRGTVINPQFWPANYEHRDKKIAIIGSGATCISLFPALAESAAQVTIVQRSPSYVISTSHLGLLLSPLLEFLHVPLSIQHRCERLWVTFLYQMIALICAFFPVQSRGFLRKLTIPQLPKGCDHDIHFKPLYDPWKQRLCICPDGDFFKTLHKPNTGIVTGHIDRVTENAIKMQDGTVINVDTIVTATGITMRLGGHIDISVDGKKMKWEDKLIWNGCMLDGIPNMVFLFSYTNFAWTLGADNTARTLLRLMKLMRSKGLKSITPQLPEEGILETRRLWSLDSTYSLRAAPVLPRYGTKGPWKPRIYGLLDEATTRWGNVTDGLRFTT
ncbi:FAD/NAD(P)-binding domain-containing protein [Annulohypoxylon maeteangense]|uniref:FAD/NAD(P)-binding domain-containing protein n=1 Tax=Annulohypoxylon maeteangense TaxID=1927788 RepID=UPI0020089699|nr:FAD/NAD(P)-binding domain-containing protein [Annulohypoxylon maeteangense]KAI0890470.1 FAD/NAD(P)-binding domain-containing protein [Annulohypoxylon maeteangense]